MCTYPPLLESQQQQPNKQTNNGEIRVCPVCWYGTVWGPLISSGPIFQLQQQQLERVLCKKKKI